MDYKLSSMLLKVEKPARYIGGEYNAAKIKEGAALEFLMCFPDVYEVAMSNLGIKILSGILNNRPDTSCETMFCPWPDFGEALKKEKMPLFSLETKKSAALFDIIGFSLQYELSITNVLYMLDLSGVPLLASDRKNDDPVIIAGGPAAINPAPFAAFFDVFCIGDGEDVINSVADEFIKNKAAGGSKRDFLQKIAILKGVYVPEFSKTPVKRAVKEDLDAAFYPLKVPIPNIEAVHNRAVLEVMRGCTRGCRFCQAGMIYRPVRERSVPVLKDYFNKLTDYNGFNEISLSSLSTCDFSGLSGLIKEIGPAAKESKVNISLPSTRLDSFESEYVESSRKSSLTFAPEAATQRLRDVINKNISEEDIFRSLKYAFDKGYHSIKLYFMIGLPTETKEDVLAIIDMAKKIKGLYRSASSKKPLNLSVSASTFVPKPFTPFQWEKQISYDEIIEKQGMLKDALKKINVKFSWHAAESSKLEAAVSRAGEDFGKIILDAYKSGCIYDGWTEFFDFTKWDAAIKKSGTDIDGLTGEIDINAVLPWDIIDAGIKKRFLLKERETAYKAETTGDCRDKCLSCGVNALIGKKTKC